MEKALQIAQQICAGLAAAHANGILHLDLKPANVMIDGRGVARITDFSIAALQGEATEIAGTPAYMAPEQLSAGSSTVATDVFALGLVLYEMFTGRQAFAAASIQERRAFPPSFEPTAPSSYAPGLDVSIDRTILQCVVNRPTDRPQSAVAVAASLPGGDVLTAWVAAGHVPSPDVVASYGGGTKIRAAPALVLFVATVVGILLAAGNTGAMMFFRHVDFSKSPAVLEDRASAFLDSLEQVAHRVDRASWYTSLYSYAEQANVSWTDRMDSSPAHPVLYVMRQSPRMLAPSNLFATVTFRDPPLDVPGMADIALDGDGALVRFAVVPHRSDPPTSPANWPEIFAAAGLDIRQFSEIPSSNIVPVVADLQFAWTGVHHLWADTPVTVVGATFAGRPVFFDIEHPSVRPVDAGVTAPTERITQPRCW